MLQRIFFDLQNGSSFLRDTEGVEARDIDQALVEARAVIEEMRGSKDLASADDWHLVIRDESGATLRTLPVIPGD